MTSRYRLYSWNINGYRAALKKGFLDWVASEQPDVLGLQEIKMDESLLTEEMRHVPGYHTYWHPAERKGYSGVALISKEKPLRVQNGLGIERFDTEGRTIIAEYENFVLLNSYYPNGQRGDDRLQYKMEFYDAFLVVVNELRESGKKVVFCGDVNTAHKPIDLARPKENEKTSGFLPIERAWIDKLVDEEGYVDTFREICGDEPDQYSWWNMRSRARERNVGWRIDYFFISPNALSNLKGANIHQDVMGSDHCPVSIELAF